MNLLVRLITTALIAAMALVAVPATAHAADPVDPTPGCDESYVRGLELQVVEQEHDIWSLRATLAEERDEHADELRHLDRVAWETQQAHDDEVNTYSALARDAQDVLAQVRRETDETIVQRDLQILRLQARVQKLRDRIQSR